MGDDPDPAGRAGRDGLGQHALPGGGTGRLRPGAIIDRGEIIALDTRSRLVAGLGAHILELTAPADPEPVMAVLRHAPPGLGEPIRTGSTLSVPSSLAAPALTDLAGRLPLADAGARTIPIRPATLNDVFLHLTSASRARSEAPA
jgi:hypothetical protein